MYKQFSNESQQLPAIDQARATADIRPVAALIALACFFFVTPVSADDVRGEARQRMEPEGFLYGIGLAVSSQVYRDYDQRVTFFPALGYRGEKLTVFGPFVRYALSRSGPFELSLRAQPRFDGFDETDGAIFEGMDDREISMDLGLGFEYAQDDWKVELAVLRDILDRSDGRELKLGLSRVLRKGPVFIEPGIEFSFLDSRHVDYYYGVAADEVAASRARYAGDDTVNTTLGIAFVTPLWLDGLTRFGVEYTWFGSAITDSPLTDEDASFGVILAWSRFF